MSDSESSEDANLPSAAECEERCQTFVAVTGTDSACAMFFLQDRDWDVKVTKVSDDKYYNQARIRGGAPAPRPLKELA